MLMSCATGISAGQTSSHMPHDVHERLICAILPMWNRRVFGMSRAEPADVLFVICCAEVSFWTYVSMKQSLQ